MNENRMHLGRVSTGLIACLLAMASQAAAATATLYTKGIYATPEPSNGGPGATIVSQPGGGIYNGSHFWLADGISAIVRLDPDPSGAGYATETYAGYAAGGSYAQIAPDPVHNGFYVADQSSKHSVGILRLTFAANEQVGSPCQIAPSLGGRRPSAVALGPDGNLYVGFLTSGDILRLAVATTAAPPACQMPVATTIGKSIFGGRVNGLAFVGSDLYLAGKDGLTRIPNATLCLSGCLSQAVPGSAAKVNHAGIWADGINTVYYLRDNNVMSYSVSSGIHQVYASTGTLADGTVCTFAFVGGQSNLLTRDLYGNVWVGDDTSDGTGNAAGRVWFIAAGQ